MLRTYDSLGRILLEKPASVAGTRVAADGMALQVATEDEFYLEWVVWVIPAASRGLCAELMSATSVERTKTFLWSSKTTSAVAAELSLYLIHGFVYHLARAWPRRWKFCCELDAYELYVWLSGLERATGKLLYGLLRRQIVCSVIARQSGDGGWYHGPSPNMRNLTQAILYPGIGLLESALSVGRGTDTPFEVIGAPYIDDVKLAAELNAAGLAGIGFVPIQFTPAYSVHKGQLCRGVYIVLTDREACDVVDVGIVIARALCRLYPAEFNSDKIKHLLLHPATLQAIKEDKSLKDIHELWRAGVEEFAKRRGKYLIY